MLNGVGASMHPCFILRRTSMGSEVFALNCTVAFMYKWKDSRVQSNRGQLIFPRFGTTYSCTPCRTPWSSQWMQCRKVPWTFLVTAEGRKSYPSRTVRIWNHFEILDRSFLQVSELGWEPREQMSSRRHWAAIYLYSCQWLLLPFVLYHVTILLSFLSRVSPPLLSNDAAYDGVGVGCFLSNTW